MWSAPTRRRSCGWEGTPSWKPPPARRRIAESGERPVDLLVTDMMMPGIGGRELAATLAASRPGLKVLFMSGYPDPDVEGRGTMKSGAFFLGKPFQPGGLLRKVREILDH